VRFKKDVDIVKKLRQEHDEVSNSSSSKVGESFDEEYVMYYKKRLWINLGNPGGSDLTTKWLHSRVENMYPHLFILFPFAKPESWRNCKKVFFEKKENCRGCSMRDHLNQMLNFPLELHRKALLETRFSRY
jgi:hypothetical protein